MFAVIKTKERLSRSHLGHAVRNINIILTEKFIQDLPDESDGP